MVLDPREPVALQNVLLRQLRKHVYPWLYQLFVGNWIVIIVHVLLPQEELVRYTPGQLLETEPLVPELKARDRNALVRDHLVNFKVFEEIANLLDCPICIELAFHL